MADEKIIKVEGKEVPQSEVTKALALLEKQKLQRAKQAEKSNNPEVIAKRKEYSERQRITHRLILEKAVKAGITVSPAEVDAAIKAKAAA